MGQGSKRRLPVVCKSSRCRFPHLLMVSGAAESLETIRTKNGQLKLAQFEAGYLIFLREFHGARQSFSDVGQQVTINPHSVLVATFD